MRQWLLFKIDRLRRRLYLSATRIALLPALVAFAFASPALADPTPQELMAMRKPLCDAAYALGQAEMDAGGKLASEELWWSLDYFNAAAGRRDMLEVCGRVPTTLAARANQGASALEAIPFDTTSPDGLRWKALWDEWFTRTVDERLKFGVVGSTIVVIGEPSELERLSVTLGGRNLLRFGNAFQLRSSAHVDAF